MAGIPDAIKALAEMSPVEDVVLPILRNGLPGMDVNTLVAADQPFPFVLVRRGDSFGDAGGDARFVDEAVLIVHTFAPDPDGDEDAAILAEAVRVVLRDAWLDQVVVPGRGHITRFRVIGTPRRAPDWVTATGPVQYADLPTGIHRYETRYELEIRRPSQPPYPLPTP